MFAQASWYFANPENLQVFKLISQVLSFFLEIEKRSVQQHSLWILVSLFQVIREFARSEIKQASSLFDCDIKLDDNFLKSY